jgi:dienelactone hydrolase
MLTLFGLGWWLTNNLGSSVQTEKVSYRSGGETVNAFLYVPAGKGPNPALVMIHGDFGPTPWVREQAKRMSEKGMVTLAIDLYRGELPKNIEEAHILERGLPEDQLARDLKAAVDYLQSRPEVRKNAMGFLGFDMGGGHALEAAIADGRIKAVVNCYGRVPTEPDRLKNLQASVFGIFAGKDEGITAQTLEQFQSAMKKAGKRLAGIHVFSDCPNGFLDPQSPYLDGRTYPRAVADAWKKIDDYLAKELK